MGLVDRQTIHSLELQHIQVTELIGLSIVNIQIEHTDFLMHKAHLKVELFSRYSLSFLFDKLEQFAWILLLQL